MRSRAEVDVYVEMRCIVEFDHDTDDVNHFPVDTKVVEILGVPGDVPDWLDKKIHEQNSEELVDECQLILDKERELANRRRRSL